MKRSGCFFQSQYKKLFRNCLRNSKQLLNWIMGTIKLHKCMLQQNKENRELRKLTQEEYNDLLYSRWFSYKGQATYAVLSYIELTSLYQFHVHSLLIFKFLRIERPLPAAFIQTFDASSVLTRNDATPASNWYDAGPTISPPCTDSSTGIPFTGQSTPCLSTKLIYTISKSFFCSRSATFKITDFQTFGCSGSVHDVFGNSFSLVIADRRNAPTMEPGERPIPSARWRRLWWSRTVRTSTPRRQRS